jgi:alkylation response protein AidB-like acyl-CoA dehydrogenase
MYDGDRSLVDGLWKALSADLGLAGLLVPEELGGAGASAREAAVVLEELGRVVRAGPVPDQHGGRHHAAAALDGRGADLLGELAAGERTAALARALVDGSRTRLCLTSPTPAARRHGHERRGCARGRRPAGRRTGRRRALALHAVPAAEADVTPVSSLDMTRQLADVTLDGAHGTLLVLGVDAAIRARARGGRRCWPRSRSGVARWCLEDDDRLPEGAPAVRPGGRRLPGAQAPPRRPVRRGGVGAGCCPLRGGCPRRGTRTSRWQRALPQAYAGDVAVHAAEEAVQLHGGIGMTWEHPAHLYLKKAKADQIAFGTPGAHRAALAPLIDLA